ncbi:MAG TPA: hypothetical protein VIW03_11570 [Anaeromyxobacter sp.]
MTTTTSAAPQFSVRSRHSALRALVIAALCSALAGTFIAEVWNAPAPAASQHASVRA